MLRRLALAALLVPGLLPAQSQQEFAARRAALADKLGDGVIVALGAREPEQDHLSFSQSPRFYYLTGFREPDAALVMVKKDGAVRSASMFVLPRQPSREVWTGARLGVDGVGALTGIRGRSAAEFPTALDSLAGIALPMYVIGQMSAPPAPEDRFALPRRTPDEQAIEKVLKHHTTRITVVNDVLDVLRGTKSAAELALIRTAVDITVLAHREAIPNVKEGANEFELQALIEYTFRRNGADRPSFATIVGSGPNSTTLHYNVNDRFIGANEMVVMDIGASYKGYSADVTRSVPSNGRFSPQQRAVYQIVRDAQAAAERQATPGASARLMNDSATAVITAGLTRLGLIESPSATYDCGTPRTPRQCAQFNMYYMHGLGHGIGLEVHDPEQYYYSGRLAKGSAFTIEPGIYVRERVLDEMADTPRNREIANRLRAAVAAHRNIGVRIEDDYAITEAGLEWLSKGVPREIADVEALMRVIPPGPAKRDQAMVERYRNP